MFPPISLKSLFLTLKELERYWAASADSCSSQNTAQAGSVSKEVPVVHHTV